ncbi:grainyhead-like protein 1 homolog [Tigriopus californicus]|uniref:grainyhead-like protein 1 homolog n=1 Tax=Tigriopus californicus TaxID=6832 RepID=UPI0027DA0B26|nr:grainyhead-like protein 1 homolog [Tigriopus californicus]|eukprot:TCALIF_10389-PA protein Name:"Similar to grhl2 Grainyhead-like protein 2 homolog (Xenopus tropicalis)" AED:0.17 eAED:0.17 QI:0/0/0/1/1/1/2/0/623
MHPSSKPSLSLDSFDQRTTVSVAEQRAPVSLGRTSPNRLRISSEEVTPSGSRFGPTFRLTHGGRAGPIASEGRSPLTATLAALMRNAEANAAPRRVFDANRGFSPVSMDLPESSLVALGPASDSSLTDSTTLDEGPGMHPSSQLLGDTFLSAEGSSPNRGSKKGRKRAREDSQDNSDFRGVTSPSVQLGTWLNSACKEGFVYTLDAPTSGFVRHGEDSLTYLNKDQFYGLTLEYCASEQWACPSDTAVSIIMLQFREKKEREEARNHWRFWQKRQHSSQTRLLDLDIKNSSGVSIPFNEIAHNAVMICWQPRVAAAQVQVAIRCLSTDFSSQKGVKGIPLHIQVDTYDGEKPNGLVDRAFCQIKTFCDKGAERKTREEERRMMRSGSSSNFTFQPQPQSLFQRAFDLVTEPILYDASMTPSPAFVVTNNVAGMGDDLSDSPDILPSPVLAERISEARDTHHGLGDHSEESSRAKGNRVMLYVRQDEEEILTPVHVVPPSAPGLIRAIASKYVLDAIDVRFLFRRTHNDLLVKMDDEMIRHYVDGDVFIMKVLSTRDIGNGKEFFDIILEDAILQKAGVNTLSKPVVKSKAINRDQTLSPLSASQPRESSPTRESPPRDSGCSN